MNETLKAKRLPLGNQTFAKIIEENLLYADKTKFIHDLIQSSRNNYFLSRPRRFGKTLLLNTIKELFSGNSELFKDLWIGRSGYGFPKHPVLSLTMSM
ncbi:MAG: AAA family ATPase, partial [Deltaproteobacteria bacterium]|nr:AAA family ATPase [Deltaproteobacteria bacterium]